MINTHVLQLDKYSPFSWVALNENGEVIGEGTTLLQAADEAKQRGLTHPVFLKLPPRDAVYVPTSF